MKKEVFVPLKINTRKGRKACIIKPQNGYVVTPLSRLLAKAHILEKRLLENPRISQKEFCELNDISPRYLRGILRLNILAPKLKREIMDGWMPKNISVERMVNGKIPVMWEEQIRYFFDAK